MGAPRKPAVDADGNAPHTLVPVAGGRASAQQMAAMRHYWNLRTTFFLHVDLGKYMRPGLFTLTASYSLEGTPVRI